MCLLKLSCALLALTAVAEARPAHLRQERVTAKQAKRAEKQGKARL